MTMIQFSQSSNIKWHSRSEISSLKIPDDATTSVDRSDNETLWLFLDESGNFDFTEKGTSYFIMTCLVAQRPFSACHDLMEAKYDFFEKGITMKKFHATEDTDIVRQSVYGIIRNHLESFSAYSIYVDKGMLDESSKDAGVLYGDVFKWITEEVLSKEVTSSTKKIVMVTDDIPKEADRKKIAKPLKRLLSEFARESGISTYLEHYPSESDFNLQIADYLCWAFMRSEAKGMSWPFSKVESAFAETGRLEK